MSWRVNSSRSRPCSSQSQSTQEISLSWHQALLLPFCVRPVSPPAQGVDLGVFARAFDATVPADVVVVAVAVALLVGLVVLLVIADEVAQGEAVVRGHEVDAGVRAAAAPLVQVAAARQAEGEVVELPRVAAPETPHVVAVDAVPLGPQHGEVADL